jgi:hypothetical protein
MMMKIKLLFLFVLSYNAIMTSQTDLVWSDKVITDFNFGYSPTDFPKVSVQNNVIKALGLSDTNSDNKLQLVEYSLDGEILNTKLYGIAPSEDDRVNSYKFDANGNLYLLKRINLNFDDTSLVLQKYDSDANIIWQQQLVEGQDIQYGGTNIELLNENQVFIGVQGYDMFGNGSSSVFSYNNDGTFLWQVDMPEIEFFTSEIKSYDNNVIVFGFNNYPFHSMITIEPDGTKTVVENIEFIRGLEDIFVDENLEIFATHGSLYWLTKLNGSGQVIWSTLYDDQIQGMGAERINAFIKDDQGNIYVTGHFPGGYTGEPNDEYLDFLTLKLNSEGEILWENRYHRSVDSGEQAFDLALKNGFIYVCGESSNDGIGTDHDFVVIKMNASNGEETTHYRHDNNGYEDCFYSMEVLDTNEIIVTGFSSEEFGATVNLITQKLSGVTGTLSISEIKRDNISLNPNPINSNGILKIQNNYFSKYSILTINGVEVQSGHLEIENYSEIQLNNYSGGLYLLVLKSDTETITKKLVIK